MSSMFLQVTPPPGVHNPQQHGGGDVDNNGANISQHPSGGDGINNDNCRRSFDNELLRRIEHAKHDRHTLMQDYAPSDTKMGTFSTGCLLLNRVIGTGIFESPKSVWLGTRSVSGALFMWCVGSLIAFSGLLVYLELGLTIPRYLVRGKWRSVPRSGGEKNYLEYMFRKPKFLALSTFAVVYIIIGGSTGNAIVFSTKILEVMHYPETVDIHDHRTAWKIKGIAAAAITCSGLLHGLWRAGGIWVQNTLGVVKLGILWFFIVAGLAAYSGKIHRVQNPGRELSTSSSFKDIDVFTTDYGANGWITTLLDVTFSYSGYESIQHVLSEVKHPQKNLKLASLGCFSLISISYILANVSFFTVVRPEQLMTSGNTSITSIFLQNVFDGNDTAKRALPALVAISAFGNIVGTTFSAARVKQEIAKDGILPFSSFWRSVYVSPIRRLLRAFGSTPPGSLEYPAENTPIPALLLHCLMALIMILSLPSASSYRIFSRLYSYMIIAWLGVFLSGGLLYHGYFKQYRSDQRGGTYRWKNVAGFRPWLGPVFPLIYFVVCLVTVVGCWLPPTQGEHTASTSARWFTVPVLGFGLVAAGIIYWFALTHMLPLWSHKTLRVRRTPFLDADENFRFEEVIAQWIAGPEAEFEEEPDDPDLR